MTEFIMLFLFAVQIGVGLDSLKTDYEILIDELGAIKGIEVVEEGDHAAVFFKDATFDSGSYELKGAAISIAKKVADVFKVKLQNRILYIEGRTDRNGNEASNNALSLKRANSIAEKVLLVGFDPDYLFVKGLGETSPICEYGSGVPEDECDKMNRSVKILVLKKK